ncbi:MAG TPA: hypothetical protein PLY70_08530 [Saprospiraceae bacterium]|mgnify:CR=1 FL=1|nr:hypothetical protein [Saprospiraceae bacterium]HPN69658.1 hypothetical protein [Saprospiraceae bacterium]
MNLFNYKVLLLSLIFSIGCGNERSNFLGWDTRLKIMNTQNIDYYYCASFVYPNLELVENNYSQRFSLPAISTDVFTTQCCWEELLQECCKNHLILDFFTKENYEKQKWETIRDQNLIDTQLIFTVEQLDSMDWIVKF